jgi:hypothetical protein
MRNRKRRDARPDLELMETRVVPSVLGVTHHRWRAVEVHVGAISNSVRQATASQRHNNEALKRLEHQENLVRIRSLERMPSALPTAAEKRAGQISNLIQSIEKSL